MSIAGVTHVAVTAAALSAAVVANAQEIEIPEVTGPLVGHVTHDKAELWLWAPAAGEIEVAVHEVDAPDARNARTVVDVEPPLLDASRVWRVPLALSSPSTTYAYAISLDGVSKPEWSGVFTTAPRPGSPSRFTIATSSCMNIDDPDQSSWSRLLAERPAFQLLLGDNHYADTTDHDTIVRHHLRYRTVPEFAQVIRDVPTYAMWDDHDYGPNNSDGTEPGKADSLRAFRAMFANPAAGAGNTPGAFYRFSWGDVDFFVLDERYHRSPNAAPNDEHKRMLGDAQFQWLIDGLAVSTATFKIIASGSTLMESESDGWRHFDFARERLLRSIMEERIGGVVYLSGDVHYCMLDEHAPIVPGGYPIYEVISSGITRGDDRGFATLAFDTTLEDPTVRVRIMHGDGTVPLDRTISRSQLEVKSP